MTNNPVYYFFHTSRNMGSFVLRIVVAMIFFFHSSQKIMGWFDGVGWNKTIEIWTSDAGLGLPYVVASFIVISEAFICILLFFGFFTRLAGMGVVVIMSGAIVVLSRNTVGFVDYELPIMIWTAGLSLFCLGGGTFSIDRAISKNLLPVVG